MQQQAKEYKKLMQTGVFFAPIVPQLGFLLFFIHLWLKKSDFVSCIKEDFKNRINLIVISSLSILMLGSVIFAIVPIGHSVEYILYILFVILGFYSLRVSTVIIPDLLKPYIYAVSIETVFGIFQWLFHIEMIQQVGPLLVNIYFFEGNRISSLAGNPLVFAGLATFAFLFAIILFLYYKTNIRYLYLVLAVIAFISELLTQSRANFLAMIIALALVLFIYYRKSWLVNISLLVTIVLFTLVFGKYQDNIPQLITGNKAVQYTLPTASGTSAPDTIGRFKDMTGSGRVGLWKDSITLVIHRPIFGYGPNSWPIAMKNLVGSKYEISDAHNTFLRLSADFGLPFAFIFLLFLGYKLIDRFREGQKDVILVGLSSGIVTIMFLGLVDNPLSSITITTILVIIAGLLWRFERDISS